MKGSLNPLNAELNPICHLLVLLGAHSILHISRIRVKLIFRIGNSCVNLIETALNGVLKLEHM
jgi:hypothetical protein